MFIQIDDRTQGILACPVCKNNLSYTPPPGPLSCAVCNTQYPAISVDTGAGTEYTYDFRINRPDFCSSPSQKLWKHGQDEYEEFQDKISSIDNYDNYVNEISIAKEIYTEEYLLDGAVLDVGGHQGRVRHFVNLETTHYVSIDPFPGVFKHMSKQPALLKAYPALNTACNFVAGLAEALPFADETFNWVHMRSVLDHFEDPYIALKEAARVLKPGGKLIIGLAIMEKLGFTENQSKMAKMATLFKNEGVKGVAAVINTKVSSLLTKGTLEGDDHHLYHLSYEHLKNLMEATGYTIVKEHWQKPPFQHCIYICGQK
jgi:ubiquinone/menaquinone biosynthesis C-methylase UbiE